MRSMVLNMTLIAEEKASLAEEKQAEAQQPAGVPTL